MTPTEDMVRVAQRAYTDALIEGGLPMRAALTAALAAMWRPIETAPKDGRTILVHFVQHGWMTVLWTDHDGDSNSPYAHWHVDDHKHGPYSVRGYLVGDDTHWMPLPPAPSQLSKRDDAERDSIQEA